LARRHNRHPRARRSRAPRDRAPRRHARHASDYRWCANPDLPGGAARLASPRRHREGSRLKAKAMPEQRFAPRHDPMLDRTRGEFVRDALGRWTAAIALVLGLAAAQGYLDGLDAADELKAKNTVIVEKSRQVMRLQHELGVRVASGSCSTLFYLIEAD